MTNRLPSSDRDPFSGSSRDVLPLSSELATLCPVAPQRQQGTNTAQWFLPEPFEPGYAYPLLVWLVPFSSDIARREEIAGWADEIGRQNLAVVAVPTAMASTSDDAVARTEAVDAAAHALAAAWLSKPSELTIREDRTYAVGCGAAGNLAVATWLAGRGQLAGAAAIRPTSVARPSLPTGRQPGRLLVTTAGGWRQTALALFAAGSSVSLEPKATNAIDVAAVLRRWVLEAIPTVVGLREAT